MNPPLRLSLALAAFLLPAPLRAWTEDDLRVAERRMKRQLATQRLAEAAEVDTQPHLDAIERYGL